MENSTLIDSHVNDEILYTEKVGDMCIAVTKDACQVSCKVDAKIDGLQATGLNLGTLMERNLLKEARKGVGKAFRSGVVMGFHLAADGLLVLYIAINFFKLYHGDD
ncbi:hypothetical protein Nepgr_010845 [Nepenthes gracilis]|uniref:Uncharacterized protein n=1 Tax=Nepenthes gracilis TaxID=150966 RepID=A0AAD3SD20_NEPGR|nr:hypothetical protein Nepgr_010845 [Nepenthes gracilis]